MKLQYFRELFEHTPNIRCNEYSCSVADADGSTGSFSVPFSDFNIPFDSVEIAKGSIVVNIISDIGYEILRESEKTGKQGKVIGIDFSPYMMYRARFNVEKNGCKNVFFREVCSPNFLPLGANIADILIFNKLLNRYPNKNLFSEIYRTLKPGGDFYIYDFVSDSPDCAGTGVKSKRNYIKKLINYGFNNISVKEFLKDISIGNQTGNSDKKLNVANLNTALISGKK
jgi:SAM-dependent methyltransferase